ncbi:glutathione peroxidase [Tabrizicola fusiformis]|uniref:glutathione peroxidase n=1 Tax=Tabrizicola sp. SY72 TaxID=2741673 RepID=UPI001571FC6F|nr:glutathione peroxidase [Tabrizicola sp. SY72]NTT86702.1 glutathione peroxidase [Tabrizicola sp. SY72]
MPLARFALALILVAAPALAAEPGFTFRSIDGGSYDSADWRGKPVLVVNTASLCGFAPQLADLQSLSDAYAGRAVVLAVPSDDFNQELGSEAEVKEFCALNYDLTLPMTTIEHVAKGKLHPFYAWVKAEHGFTPGWNFNKVLIGPDGQFIKAWGAVTNPGSAAITSEIDALLN